MRLSEMLNEKKRQRARKERIASIKKVAAGTAVGILSGLAGGFLFSPKSGKENRDSISNLAKIANEKVIETKDNLNEAKEKISNYVKDKRNGKCCCTEVDSKEAEITVENETVSSRE